MRICLCPASIAWIRRNLKKSARSAFTSLLKRNTTSKPKRGGKRKSKGSKRKTSKRKGGKKRLSAGVHWVKLKGGKRRKVRVLRNGQWRFMKG